MDSQLMQSPAPAAHTVPVMQKRPFEVHFQLSPECAHVAAHAWPGRPAFVPLPCLWQGGTCRRAVCRAAARSHGRNGPCGLPQQSSEGVDLGTGTACLWERTPAHLAQLEALSCAQQLDDLDFNWLGGGLPPWQMDGCMMQRHRRPCTRCQSEY